jgi:transposase-like protein
VFQITVFRQSLVLDGAKALHAAAKRVWDQNGVIQRCQVHKKRNVKAHVPQKHHAEFERRLSEAYHETGYEAAKASLEATARWLERITRMRLRASGKDWRRR